MVMLGTKRPSITSTCIQSAPAASTARTSSPNRVKSADRTDGAIRIGAVAGAGTRGRTSWVAEARLFILISYSSEGGRAFRLVRHHAASVLNRKIVVERKRS